MTYSRFNCKQYPFGVSLPTIRKVQPSARSAAPLAEAAATIDGGHVADTKTRLTNKCIYIYNKQTVIDNDR